MTGIINSIMIKIVNRFLLCQRYDTHNENRITNDCLLIALVITLLEEPLKDETHNSVVTDLQ